MQRQWVAANRDTLIAELVTKGHVAEIVETFDAVVVRVTPDPDPTAQQPVSGELPESTDTVLCAAPVWESPVMAGTVRCVDCQHGSRALPGDELAAWRHCEAGQGGRFALARHRCQMFKAAI